MNRYFKLRIFFLCSLFVVLTVQSASAAYSVYKRSLTDFKSDGVLVKQGLTKAQAEAEAERLNRALSARDATKFLYQAVEDLRYERTQPIDDATGGSLEKPRGGRTDSQSPEASKVDTTMVPDGAASKPATLAELAENEARAKQVLKADEILLRSRNAELTKEAAAIDRMREAIQADKRSGKDTSARDAEYKKLLEAYEKKAAQFGQEKKNLMGRGDILQTLRDMQVSTFDAIKLEDAKADAENREQVVARTESSEAAINAKPSKAPLISERPRMMGDAIGTWNGSGSASGYMVKFEPGGTGYRAFGEPFANGSSPSRFTWTQSDGQIEVTYITSGGRSSFSVKNGILTEEDGMVFRKGR